MIKKFEHFVGMRNIAYAGIMLNKEYRNKLISEFKDIIPTDWKIFAHHMTICIGELPTIYRDYRGEEIELEVTHYGMNENVLAVKVSGFFTINRKIAREITDERHQHITIAVRPPNSPKIANEINDWIKIKPFVIKGTVKEIESN